MAPHPHPEPHPTSAERNVTATAGEDDAPDAPDASGFVALLAEGDLELDELLNLDDLDDGDLAGDEDADDETGNEDESLSLGPDALPFDASHARLGEAEQSELEEVAERIRRRMADQELLDELRALDFTGPGYQEFVDDLGRYAMSVAGGWLRTGHIFTLTRDVSPSEAERTELFSDEDARVELATMTIATALPRFRQKALIEGGWDPDKGASITTYFMRACIFAFPNQFRARRRERDRWQRSGFAERAGQIRDLDRSAVTDPAMIALGNMRIMDDLNRTSYRAATIVALTIDGYSQLEIADMLGEENTRIIEGVLYRWRKRERARLRTSDTQAETCARPSLEGDRS